MLLFPAWAMAQDTLLPTRHFTFDNGLPTKQVYNLSKDHDGFIWLASQNGVFRFDGKNFYTYTTREGLCDNEIIEIYTDSRNVVWCTGFNGRVSFIENGVVNPGDSWLENFEASQHIKDIVEDSHGNLYLASEYEKIYRLDARRRLTGTYTGKGFITFLGQCGDVLEIFWRYRYEGYDVNHGYRNTFVHRHKYSYQRMFLSKMHRGIWILGENGYLRNECSGKEIRLDRYEKERITYVLEVDDRYAVISFGLGKALLYDFRTAKSKVIRVPPEASVVDAVPDNEGHVWLSGYNGGFFSIELPGRARKECLPGFGNHVINSFKEGTRLWALSDKGEVSESDETGTLRTHSMGRHPGSLNWGNSFFKRIGHRVFLVSEYGMFDMARENPEPIKPGGKDIQIYHDTLMYANQGLLSTEGAVDADLDYFVKDLYKRNIILRERTFAIALQGDTLWMSTQSGLRSFHVPARSLGEYVYRAPGGSRIEKIQPWKYGLLLLVTSNNGIVVFDGKKPIAEVTVKNGLYSNDCKEIDLWERGWLVRHAYGLSLVDVMANRIRTVSQWQHIPMLSVNNMGVYGDTVLLSTRSGLYRVLLSDIFSPQPEQRKLRFMRVTSGDEQFLPHDVRLGYRQNRLKIIFSLPEFTSPQQVQYRWRLNGGEWSDLSVNALEFANLRAGKYVLELKARASNHEWSEASVLRFTVASPFWQAWWFWLTTGAVALLLGWIILRARYRKKLATEREKASVRYQLMDFEQKALNAMMNPHFVFNAMGSIQHLLNQGDNRQANDYLVKFSRLIRKSLETSQLEFCYLDDEIERLTLYLQLEKMRFGGRMEFSLEVTDDLDPEQVKIPTMILQTYVENAVIHGVAAVTRVAWVNIRFSSVPGGIRVEIADNGPGFDASDRQKRSVRFGVSATEKRLKLLTQLTGKPFSVNIVSPVSAEAGTRVELLFSARE